jgi:hypothetical protein
MHVSVYQQGAKLPQSFPSPRIFVTGYGKNARGGRGSNVKTRLPLCRNQSLPKTIRGLTIFTMF